MKTNQDISDLESQEWIAIYKPGLLNLIKEKTDLLEENIKLKAELTELKKK